MDKKEGDEKGKRNRQKEREEGRSIGKRKRHKEKGEEEKVDGI